MQTYMSCGKFQLLSMKWYHLAVSFPSNVYDIGPFHLMLVSFCVYSIIHLQSLFALSLNYHN